MANLLTRLESQLTFPTRATLKLFEQVQKMDQMMAYASSLELQMSSFVPPTAIPLEQPNDVASRSGIGSNRAEMVGWNAEGVVLGVEADDTWEGGRTDKGYDELVPPLHHGGGSTLDDWSELFDLGPEMVFPDLAEWFT